MKATDLVGLLVILAAMLVALRLLSETLSRPAIIAVIACFTSFLGLLSLALLVRRR